MSAPDGRTGAAGVGAAGAAAAGGAGGAASPSGGASPIPGVLWGRATRHADARGGLAEIARASAMDLSTARTGVAGGGAIAQANLSVSHAGVLRGLHLHRRQLDRWYVAAGRAFVALVDVRPLLADPRAAPRVETRTAIADAWVEIPAGVAHGFLALEALTLVYVVTNEYDGTDELGFAWDDPDAAVAWPPVPTTADGLPILSDRDRANPSLRELVARIRADAGHR
jgi:dTDP-4-dehydrorhamnose 3,5-epimerase